ncbi:hypothetical protein BJ508DRAFT_338311 [Ascobolus immersus RN42]|uniref:F-box domain-containing protein n=1 Tax=Ascobolus immersus RN42 TaxID=1160509 RepID=A0A3N4IKI1_ASCIM|nr:hypothetical protein BJ508DRAFT_338311 [Ascobolus immersus RN42]
MEGTQENSAHTQNLSAFSIIRLPVELRMRIYSNLRLIYLLQLSHASTIFYKDINQLWHTSHTFRSSFHPKLATLNKRTQQSLEHSSSSINDDNSHRLTLSSLQHVHLASAKERNLFTGTSLYAPKRPEPQIYLNKGFWPCKTCFKFYTNRAFLRWETEPVSEHHCLYCDNKRRFVLGENCRECSDMEVEAIVPIRRQFTGSVCSTRVGSNNSSSKAAQSEAAASWEHQSRKNQRLSEAAQPEATASRIHWHLEASAARSTIVQAPSFKHHRSSTIVQAPSFKHHRDIVSEVANTNQCLESTSQKQQGRKQQRLRNAIVSKAQCPEAANSVASEIAVEMIGVGSSSISEALSSEAPVESTSLESSSVSEAPSSSNFWNYTRLLRIRTESRTRRSRWSRKSRSRTMAIIHPPPQHLRISRTRRSQSRMSQLRTARAQKRDLVKDGSVKGNLAANKKLLKIEEKKEAFPKVNLSTALVDHSLLHLDLTITAFQGDTLVVTALEAGVEELKQKLKAQSEIGLEDTRISSRPSVSSTLLAAITRNDQVTLAEFAAGESTLAKEAGSFIEESFERMTEEILRTNRQREHVVQEAERRHKEEIRTLKAGAEGQIQSLNSKLVNYQANLAGQKAITDALSHAQELEKNKVVLFARVRKLEELTAKVIPHILNLRKRRFLDYGRNLEPRWIGYAVWEKLSAELRFEGASAQEALRKGLTIDLPEWPYTIEEFVCFIISAPV